MNKNYTTAQRAERERFTNQNIVRGYQPGRGTSRTGRAVKRRKSRIGLWLPLLMIAGAMTLSLLIIKSEFIASPVYKPADVSEPQEEVPESTENSVEGQSMAAGGSKSKPALDKYLVLVNSDNLLDRDYRPGNMVDIQKQIPSLDRQILLERTAAEAFKALVQAMDDAAAMDISMEELVVVSGYRTYEYQENLFDKEINENMKTMSQKQAELAASKLVALPGGSEHQTGLAVDVSTASLGYKLLESFRNTASHTWLLENCADFGFIIRYPEDKYEITGISHEPWHLRYVGAEHARFIMERGLTLEEYIERIS